MLFTLKKVIGNMLLPLPLMLLIIGAGLALLWFSRFQKTGKIFISIGWLALLLLSLQPVADRLLRPIESTYPTWNNSQKVDYIVVLGGGYTWNPQWAPSSNLINNSLPRLNEGIRLWRENPGSKLIFTGGVAKTNTVSTAEVGARVAQSLGVPREMPDMKPKMPTSLLIHHNGYRKDDMLPELKVYDAEIKQYNATRAGGTSDNDWLRHILSYYTEALGYEMLEALKERGFDIKK